MLQHGQRITFQERLDIMERATAGQSDPEIAAALSCSLWTVRKWRRIGQRHGRNGLTSQMGRPATGPLSSISPALHDAILHLRRTHPGWGPDTLLERRSGILNRSANSANLREIEGGLFAVFALFADS